MKNYNVATTRISLRKDKEGGILFEGAVKVYRDLGIMVEFGKKLLKSFMGNTFWVFLD